jgi:hypothetical protein
VAKDSDETLDSSVIKVLQELAKQPYWVTTLILGVAMVAFPCVTIDKEYHWATHPPSTFWLVGVGIILLLLSTVSFGFTLVSKRTTEVVDVSAGLDLTRVKEGNGVMWTLVSGCEIRVVEGRIEEYIPVEGTAIVLPCNEYFDDRCVDDTRSALGAYVNRVFEGQATAFNALVKSESRKKLGPAGEQQKTDDERAESFGAGRCLLLIRPLGRSIPVALISTTTQRAGQGLAGRISYLFEGMQELVTRLADARLTQVAMPVLGAGHGRIASPLAFVSLLLAVAEAARYGQGGQRLRKATIVVFKRDVDSPAAVDRVVVRRALALIGSGD